MLYTDHWNEIKTRMAAYWQREPMERCCAGIIVPKPGYTDFGEVHFYFDTEQDDAMHRRRFQGQEYLWEAIPCLFPYFGTSGVAEYAGSEPVYAPRTTWFEPCLDEPDAERVSFCRPEAFRRQKDAITRLLEKSHGDYAVSVTDNCGIADALAALRGSDNLLMDMVTDPEFISRGIQKLMPIYKETQEELFSLTYENNEGSILSWMHLWAPSRCAQMQCDLSVMISNEMFNRFIMPELQELTEFLDYPVYHFDGREQIRHLDSLLSLKKLRAIQWTPVVGQPPTSEFIPQLQKIQKAGKNLVLFPQAKEVEKLLDNLSSRGLQMVNGVSTMEEAKELQKIILTHSRDRG